MRSLKHPAVSRWAVPAVLAVCAAAALPPMTAHATPQQASGSDDLNSRTGHTATFARHSRTGDMRFFGTRPGHAAHRPSDISASDAPSAAAGKWLAHYGGLFGVPDAARDLHTVSRSRLPQGSIVKVQQTIQGLPVVGGQLVVVLDSSNELVSIDGEALPPVTMSTTSRLTADAAARLAIRKVARSNRTAVLTQLSASTPVLSVLDQRLLGGLSVAGPAMVWATTVSSVDRTVRHDVFVDAVRGGVLLDLDANPQAKSRLVCTAGGGPTNDPGCPGPETTQVGTEASPPPAPADGGDADTYNSFRFSGAVYDFYSALLGRDGIDGSGGTIASTVHFCPVGATCPGYQNAFWDGAEMVYGDGFTSALDVVGHELTHGITEKTSNLFSYYQSGAINESISDVMGELMQQIEGPALNATGQTDVYDPAKAWTVGEKLPVDFTRHMDDPTLDNAPAAGDPDKMTSSLYSAVNPWQPGFDSGGVHANDGVNNKAAYLMAVGGTFNAQTVAGVSGADQVEKDVKVANIYYQLEFLMTSASDYADLFRLLPQACNLVSARGNALPLPAARTTAVTAGDCAEVVKAVTATEMDKQPLSVAAQVPAQAPEGCSNGGARTSSRLDAFDVTNPLGNGYSRVSAGTDSFGLRSFGQWWWSKQAITDYGSGVYLPPYASSGTGVLWGDDADPTTFDPTYSTYDRQDSYARTTTAITARVGTFVRFNHAWEFDYGPISATSPVYNFDGGRVEYTVDSGTHWYDAGATSPVSSRALFVNGGYNGTVSNTSGLPTGYVDPNPLKGLKGFVGSSHGWTSSRLDLSTLNGKAVQLRWRIGADDAVGSLGWYIDDLAVYSCNPTAVTLTVPAAVVYGGYASLTAHLVRSGTTSVVASKYVQLYQRKRGTTSWTAVGAPKITNSSGNATWMPRPTVNEDYGVRFLGATPFAPSNFAAKPVLVKGAISKGTTPSTFTLGHAFTVSGGVAPSHAGKAVLLQRYYSGAWHSLVSRTLSSTSRYSIAYKPTIRGTLTFRVLFNGDADHTANAVLFTVTVT